MRISDWSSDVCSSDLVEEREVDVHAFELQSAADLLDAGKPLLRLRVECGSGTYVRSLVRDLGEELGCGAHVAEMRRLWVDPFREPRLWTLEALQAPDERGERSEEHTSELQSIMRISYA